jgi:hypothetical protein
MAVDIEQSPFDPPLSGFALQCATESRLRQGTVAIISFPRPSFNVTMTERRRTREPVGKMDRGTGPP